MNKKLFSILTVIAAIFVMQSCTKEKDDNSTSSLSDQSIARIAQSSNDFEYVNSTARTTTQSSFRIKMNGVAARAYRAGQTADFPLNSMLVREALNASGEVTGYDIMYRTNSDGNSSHGWVWTQADEDGHVLIGADQKGVQCQTCHSGTVVSFTGI